MKNTKENPLVSVIIPTYNGSKRIAKTLQSIIAQDYENIEIIVVDDVSTDNTVEVVQNTLEDSGRKFQIIKRTVNGHQSASRNTAFQFANGKYVIFFDHDDLAEKNFISRLCGEAEATNADFVLCNYYHYYENENKYVPRHLSFKNSPAPAEDYLLEWTKENDMTLTFWTIWHCIFNKNFLEKNKIRFPEDCYIAEDVEFMLKSAAFSSRISSIGDFLYTHVLHSSQQSQADIERRSNYKNFEQEVLVMWRSARCIIKHTKNKRVKNFALTFCIVRKLIQQLTRAAKAGDREYYSLKAKHLKHKKIREIFWGTGKFIFKEPELFFKALTVIFAPGLYFKMRQ